MPSPSASCRRSTSGCTKLDKRNFRRKILAADVLEETGGYLEGGQHRPAKLYRFTSAAIELEQARRRFP